MRTAFAAAAFGLVLSGLPALGQPRPPPGLVPPPPPPRAEVIVVEPEPRPIAVIDVLDANDDGLIDAQEIARAPDALRRLDVDRDGVLTFEECEATLAPPAPRPGPPGVVGPPGVPPPAPPGGFGPPGAPPGPPGAVAVPGPGGPQAPGARPAGPGGGDRRGPGAAPPGPGPGQAPGPR